MYDPLLALSQIQCELNQYFERHPAQVTAGPVSAGDWTPAVDVEEESDQFLIYADVPGVKTERVEVSMERGMLTIKCERGAGR